MTKIREISPLINNVGDLSKFHGIWVEYEIIGILLRISMDGKNSYLVFVFDGIVLGISRFLY